MVKPPLSGLDLQAPGAPIVLTGWLDYRKSTLGKVVCNC